MTNPIKPLTIGNLRLAHNLIQGPLAGVSCAPFRTLFSEFLAPAYCVTEMISAKHLIKNSQAQKRYLMRDPKEDKLCYQLSGNCPSTLAEATRIVTDLGADLIDLNCGCPKKKIRQKRCGSYLLQDPQHLATLISAMRKATSLPLTVKIRVAGPADDSDHRHNAQVAERAGADAIIVHGRHWTEDYEDPCHLDQISAIVDAVTIPVISNGDINSLSTLQQSFNTTGCAAVMISRAGTGKPWLFAQLMAEANKQSFNLPTAKQRAALLQQHIDGLSLLIGREKALLESRKWAKYYN